MKMKTLYLVALFVSLTFPAMAQTAAHNDEAAKSYMQTMKDMHDKMQSVTPTGDPNKDFVMMMKPHHQGAVDMAQAYLKYGNDPQLKSMAEKIISSQKKEIGEMDDWLAKHKYDWLAQHK